MFGILRFSATVTLAEVVRAIQRTPSRRIALVFPLATHVSLAEIGRMGVVNLLCQEQRKEATIVGGDVQLRACAVACGLRAAMTVDDWRAMRTPRNTWISWRSSARTSASARLTVLPPVVAQAASLCAERDDSDDEETDPRDDLPDYVRDLLAMHGHDVAEESSPSPRLLRAMPRHTTIAFDLDRDDDLREQWESDEQELTETIRSSSGLSRALLSSQWRGDRMSAPDGTSN